MNPRIKAKKLLLAAQSADQYTVSMRWARHVEAGLLGAILPQLGASEGPERESLSQKDLM
jgi:hypothetical protein